MNISTKGWQDITLAQPLDPRSILGMAALGGLGVFSRSTTFLQAIWGSNPFAFTGNNSQVVSLDNTDALSLQDAVQWSFAHQTANGSAALGPAMRKVVFMRAGRQWDNIIEIAFGASNYTNVQLSFRDNLGTSGSFLNSSTGGVPVVSFAGTLTGTLSFHATVLYPGVYSMVLVVSTGGVFSNFEMEWVVIP